MDVSGREHKAQGTDRRANESSDAGVERIYLDNVPNIQSSWVTQGLEIGQVALKHGANDLGSIMIEENVVFQAGTTFCMGVADMQRLIEGMGYTARQRDNW